MNTIINALNNLQTLKPLAFTENGAMAFNTTTSYCLDLFFKMVRDTSRETVQELFYNAWLVDPFSAIKILLHCRDCRHGKGERLIVLYGLSWLRKYKPMTYIKNLQTFLNIGYYKDLLNIAIQAEIEGQPKLGSIDMIELELFCEQLRMDYENLENNKPISLAAKWAPTEYHADDRNYEFASRMAKIIFPHEKISYSMKQYRLMLTKLRTKLRVVENKMSHDLWSTIDYSKVPAKSHHIHTEAFKRHDLERYMQYLDNLKKSKTQIKSTGLQPHELIKPFFNRTPENKETIQLQWNDMIQKLREKGKMGNIVSLCDVSGSMEGLPLEVCISLGLVVSELAEGPFKNKVLTFHSHPTLVDLKGHDLESRVRELRRIEWGGNTDIMAAFNQILMYAVMMNCSQEQLPKVLIIFSDMQFDEACLNDADKDYSTVYEIAKSKFEARGYKLPSVVFWNLRDTKASFPVTKNEQGVVLLSGYSAELLKAVMDDLEDISPINMLYNIINDYTNVFIHDDELGPIRNVDNTVYLYDHINKSKRRKSRGKGPGSMRRKNGNTNSNDSDSDD